MTREYAAVGAAPWVGRLGGYVVLEDAYVSLHAFVAPGGRTITLWDEVAASPEAARALAAAHVRASLDWQAVPADVRDAERWAHARVAVAPRP